MPDENQKHHEDRPFPELMTIPGWNFQREYERLLTFIHYISQLALSSDEKAKVAARALYESEDPERYRKTLKDIEEHAASTSYEHSIALSFSK